MNIIMSTARAAPSYDAGMCVVYKTQRPPEEWLTALTEAICAETGTLPEVQSLREAQVHDKLCVVVPEIGEAPFFGDSLDSETFDAIKEVLVRSRSVLWLSSGGGVDANEPLYPRRRACSGLFGRRT